LQNQPIKEFQSLLGESERREGKQLEEYSHVIHELGGNQDAGDE